MYGRQDATAVTQCSWALLSQHLVSWRHSFFSGSDPTLLSRATVRQITCPLIMPNNAQVRIPPSTLRAGRHLGPSSDILFLFVMNVFQVLLELRSNVLTVFLSLRHIILSNRPSQTSTCLGPSRAECIASYVYVINNAVGTKTCACTGLGESESQGSNFG